MKGEGEDERVKKTKGAERESSRTEHTNWNMNDEHKNTKPQARNEHNDNHYDEHKWPNLGGHGQRNITVVFVFVLVLFCVFCCCGGFCLGLGLGFGCGCPSWLWFSLRFWLWLWLWFLVLV